MLDKGRKVKGKKREAMLHAGQKKYVGNKILAS